jgi:hypothetical protein
MTWAKVDDQLHGDPRAAVAGLEAMGLYVLALSYMGAYLTDGTIGLPILKRLAGRRATALAARLVEAGLWESKPGDIWVLMSWDKSLLSRTYVERQREDKSRAGRAGATRTNARSLESGPAPADPPAAGAADAPDPDPSRSKKEDPPLSPAGGGASEQAFKLEPQEPKGKDRKKPAAPLPDGWQPNAQALVIGRQCGLDADRVRFEADRFRDHARATDRRCVLWDAAFYNWLRGAKPGPAPVTFRPSEDRGPAPPGKAPFRTPLPPARPKVNGLYVPPPEQPPPREPHPDLAPMTPEEEADIAERNRQREARLAERRREEAEQAARAAGAGA